MGAASMLPVLSIMFALLIGIEMTAFAAGVAFIGFVQMALAIVALLAD